jgi:hypothetical protein
LSNFVATKDGQDKLIEHDLEKFREKIIKFGVWRR